MQKTTIFVLGLLYISKRWYCSMFSKATDKLLSRIQQCNKSQSYVCVFIYVSIWCFCCGFSLSSHLLVDLSVYLSVCFEFHRTNAVLLFQMVPMCQFRPPWERLKAWPKVFSMTNGQNSELCILLPKMLFSPNMPGQAHNSWISFSSQMWHCVAAAAFPWDSFRKIFVQMFSSHCLTKFSTAQFLCLSHFSLINTCYLFSWFIYFVLEERILLKSPVKCLVDLYKKSYFQNILCYSETNPVKMFRWIFILQNISLSIVPPIFQVFTLYLIKTLYP